MGEVFRAWDYRLDRQVALKVPLEASQRPREVLDRFRIEVEAVERLNHENLCKLLDHDVGHVPPFLTMEYLEGGSLEDRVSAYAESSVAEVLGLVRTLALGLEHAHRHGVVHRDIKPTNVLFGADGRPRIADFGLALLTDRPLDARITEVHQVLGSLLYMSPEQVEGSRAAIDRPTDIYSLGILMFRLLTGEFPLSRRGRRSQPFLDRAGDPRRPDGRPLVASRRPGWSDRRRLPQGNRAGPGTAIPLHERDGRRSRRAAGHRLRPRPRCGSSSSANAPVPTPRRPRRSRRVRGAWYWRVSRPVRSRWARSRTRSATRRQCGR